MNMRDSVILEEIARRPPQPWPIRLTHWLNVPLLVVLAGSGLQILWAYPFMGSRGAPFGWYPVQGGEPPGWLRLGGGLAGARALHFFFAWLLCANAVLYLAYCFRSREWRRRLFSPRRDARDAFETVLRYLRIRKPAPQPELYNGLQKSAYTAAILLGAIEVLSGLAVYKPVQLSWLAAAFGGYDGARAVHLLGLAALALFTLGHLVMVAAHPKAIVEMVAGGHAAPADPEPAADAAPAEIPEKPGA